LDDINGDRTLMDAVCSGLAPPCVVPLVVALTREAIPPH